ncbi:MAG: hypothetical protein O3C40_01915 [Planctomycetota bacterium]|nr:hypothetical protein [Planctomycetota bacterium]
MLEERTLLATVNWISDTDGSWNDAANWQDQDTSGNRVPTIGDDVVIDRSNADVVVTLPSNLTTSVSTLTSTESLRIEGDLTITSDSTVGGTVTLVPSGLFRAGIDNAPATVTMTGTFNWEGGQIGDSSTDAEDNHLAIASGAVANIQAADEKSLRAHTIENSGTINWLEGDISVRNSAAVNNLLGGLFDLQTDAQMLTRSGQGFGFLNNSGTVIRSAGTGVAEIGGAQGVALTNSGLVDVQTGTFKVGSGNVTDIGDYRISSDAVLEFARGNRTLSSTSQVTGAGTVRVIDSPTQGNAIFAEVHVQGSFNPDKVVVAGGRLRFDNPTAGQVQLNQVDVQPEMVNGPSELGGTGITDVNGTLTWTGGDLGGGGGALNLRGGVLADGDNNKVFTGGTINNFATWIWRGAGELIGSSSTLVHNHAGATFDVQTDSRFRRSNGNLNFVNAGLLVKTAGDNQASIEPASFNQFTNEATGIIRSESGTLRGTELVNQGGTLAVANGATLTLLNTSSQRSITLAGGEIAGSGTIDADITNDGTARPGASSGLLTISGDYTQTAGGTLFIQIGGTTAGSGFDQLAVTGDATRRWQARSTCR